MFATITNLKLKKLINSASQQKHCLAKLNGNKKHIFQQN